MADEAQETTAAEGSQSAAGSKSKLSFKTLILIGVPLVLVQAVLAYLVVNSMIAPRLPERKEVPAAVAQEAAEEEQVEDLSQYITYEVADIIVNPAETGGQRYISVSVTIYIKPELEEPFKGLEPEVRSIIIERISRKRLDELDDFKDQQIVREEVRDDINQAISRYFRTTFQDFRVPRILFSKYTIQ